MKQKKYEQIRLLPIEVIEAAQNGEADAIEKVLRYYENYINKLCTRAFYGKDGRCHRQVDEYMKKRLQNKLVYAIVYKKAGEND